MIGRPRTALIVAPHPDDETIGAWGLMRRLIARGTRVTVLVVSDGAASHRASRRFPRARLVAERRRESRLALRRLGLGAGAVLFLGLADGALAQGPLAAVARAVRRLRPVLLVGPAGDDAHPDHRAVAAVLGPRRRLLYRVWPPRRPVRGRTFDLPLGPAAAAKRAAIRRYRTQAGLIDDDAQGFAMSRREIAAFAAPVERFRPA